MISNALGLLGAASQLNSSVNSAYQNAAQAQDRSLAYQNSLAFGQAGLRSNDITPLSRHISPRGRYAEKVVESNAEREHREEMERWEAVGENARLAVAKAMPALIEKWRRA